MFNFLSQSIKNQLKHTMIKTKQEIILKYNNKTKNNILLTSKHKHTAKN